MKYSSLKVLFLFTFVMVAGCGNDAENKVPGLDAQPVTQESQVTAEPGQPSAPGQPATQQTTSKPSGPGNTVKRIDPGNAMSLKDLPPNEYAPDAPSFYQGMNVEYFLTFQGMIEPSRFGTRVEDLKYTQVGRDNKTRYLKSLKTTHPIPFFKEKSLNSVFVLTAIVDSTRRVYDYLHDEDQNKIQLELTEVARDNTHVALRMIKTFIVPNTGKPFDGGVLVIQPSKTGNNAWLVKDTPVETSLSFLEKDGKVVALSFKGNTRSNKPMEAIFEVGAAQ